ncbi:MAG TPA: hypothetical protein VHK91_11390, partial [Flavisolibacter sp.]|nr:hypothetical protein [Flavisolibacter sp.]
KIVLNALIKHETLSISGFQEIGKVVLTQDIHLQYLLGELIKDGHVETLNGVLPLTYTITNKGIDEGHRLHKADHTEIGPKNPLAGPIHFILVMALVTLSFTSAFAQKYKNASDTVKLNKELVTVSNELAELTAKLAIAQNNLPGYQTKADDATSEAQKSADESSRQASKATNGDVGDAKKAKKKARKAYNKADDAKDAHQRMNAQDEKITKLTNQIAKKQERLKELQDLLMTFRSQQ